MKFLVLTVVALASAASKYPLVTIFFYEGEFENQVPLFIHAAR